MPDGRVLIAFASTALDTTPTWTRIDNVSPSLVSGVDISFGRQDELDQTQASTATVFVNDTDGLFDPGNTGSPYFGQLDGKQILIQNWNPVTSAWVPRWRGFIDDYGYDLHPSQLISNVQIECVDLFDYLAGVEMLPGTFGDPAPAGSEGTVYYEAADWDTRVIQLLTDAAVPVDMYVVFSGNVTVQATKYDPGDSVLVALRDAADAEFPGVANLYVDRLGRFAAHGRLARFLPDAVAGGAAPGAWNFTRWKAGDGAAIAGDPTRAQIRPPLQWSRPRSRIINAGLAYPRGIAEADIPGQIVVDTASRDLYGYRAWSATDLITLTGTTTGNTANAETKLFASHYVNNYKDPHTRVEALTFKAIDPSDARAQRVWKLLCEVDVADVVELTHSYPGGVGFTDEPFYVEGGIIQIRPANSEFDYVEVSLNVSPAAYFGIDVFNP